MIQQIKRDANINTATHNTICFISNSHNLKLKTIQKTFCVDFYLEISLHIEKENVFILFFFCNSECSHFLVVVVMLLLLIINHNCNKKKKQKTFSYFLT